MVSNKTRLVTVTSLAAAAALVLSACGGNGGGGNGGENTGGDTPAGGNGDGPERVYVEAITGDPSVMNPQFGGGPIPLRIGFAMMDPLVGINDEYEILPALAKEWDVSDDGLTITFTLEEGVEWHDGEPFTAEDVVFNFEEIIPLQTYGAQMTERMDSVEIADENTVVINMDSQYGPFLEALSQMAIVPKHVYEGTDYVTNPANMAPIGTGPMMFESYSPGSEVVLVKNPNWWRGDTEVDRTIYAIMSDANTRGLAMLNGEIDTAVLDPSAQEDVEAHPDLRLAERGVFPQMVSLTFNARLPELEDPEVRALVFSAIDRDAINELALRGLGEPTTGFFPDALEWAQNPEVNFEEDFPRDIDAINEGLDAAGFEVGADGLRFTLIARYVATHSEAEATAEVIKSSLEDVHIGVDLVGAAEPVWSEAVWGDYDFGMNILRNTVGADPSIGPARWLTCNPNDIPQNNASGVCDEELQAAADGAMEVIDRDARAEHFYTLQERARDLIYWVPLSWYNGSFNTNNISRWDGIDDLAGFPSSKVPYENMTWIGD